MQVQRAVPGLRLARSEEACSLLALYADVEPKVDGCGGEEGRMQTTVLEYVAAVCELHELLCKPWGGDDGFVFVEAFKRKLSFLYFPI